MSLKRIAHLWSYKLPSYDFPTKREEQKGLAIALDFASSLNIPVDLSISSVDYCSWDGKKISAKYDPFDIVFHEVCHYIVAHPNRRKLIDFGLGRGPNSDRKNILPIRKTIIQPQNEEDIASLLAIIVQKHFNLPFSHTLDYQNWRQEEYLHRVLRRLNRRRFIDEQANFLPASITHLLNADQPVLNSPLFTTNRERNKNEIPQTEESPKNDSQTNARRARLSQISAL